MLIGRLIVNGGGRKRVVHVLVRALRSLMARTALQLHGQRFRQHPAAEQRQPDG